MREEAGGGCEPSEEMVSRLESTLWQPGVEGRFSVCVSECRPSTEGPISTGSLRWCRVHRLKERGRGCAAASSQEWHYCSLAQKPEEEAGITSPICAFVAPGT